MAKVRTFETGATRASLEGKPQYEGYLSPLVIRRYGEFMLRHQVQADGTIREADNWQKGIPLASYMDSMWRHFLSVWLIHRGWGDDLDETLEDSLCALMFNVMGMLHEVLAARYRERSDT